MDCVNIWASSHPAGRAAREVVERARGQVAAVGQVAAPAGSACHAGNVEHSPVLRAMSVPPEIRHVADALDATVSSGAGRFAAPIVGG